MNEDFYYFLPFINFNHFSDRYAYLIKNCQKEMRMVILDRQYFVFFIFITVKIQIHSLDCQSSSQRTFSDA